MVTRGYRLELTLCFYLMLSSVIYLGDHHNGYSRMIRSGLFWVVSPVYHLIHWPFEGYHQMRHSFDNVKDLQAKNQQLKEENLNLKGLLRKFNALYFENDRLRELLRASKQLGESAIVGEMLSIDLDPSVQRIVLNKGSQDGVFINQAVLDANGIVGQVVEVSPWTSTVLVITDIDHAIPVYIMRNNIRAIAVGLGVLEQLELMNLPNTVDVRVGDILMSSGLGQRFPAGYPVGTIASVEKNQALAFAKVIVKPAARIDQLREVLFIWPQSELKSAKNTGESNLGANK